MLDLGEINETLITQTFSKFAGKKKKIKVKLRVLENRVEKAKS